MKPFNTCLGYKTLQSGPQDSFLLASQRFLLRKFSISMKMEKRSNTYWSFYQYFNKDWTMLGHCSSNPISSNSLRPILSNFMIFHILPLSATLTPYEISVPPIYGKNGPKYLKGPWEAWVPPCLKPWLHLCMDGPFHDLGRPDSLCLQTFN